MINNQGEFDTSQIPEEIEEYEIEGKEKCDLATVLGDFKEAINTYIKPVSYVEGESGSDNTKSDNKDLMDI